MVGPGLNAKPPFRCLRHAGKYIGAISFPGHHIDKTTTINICFCDLVFFILKLSKRQLYVIGYIGGSRGAAGCEVRTSISDIMGHEFDPEQILGSLLKMK